jgi:hypothetical protein
MSIATERRQFYDNKIRVAAQRRHAPVELRYWLAICRVNDKAISYLARSRIVRQFKLCASSRRELLTALTPEHKLARTAPRVTGSCALL